MLDWQKQAIETFEPATVVYEDTLKKTGSAEAAQRAAQTKKDELFEAQMTRHVDAEQRRMLENNRKYDYRVAKANLLGLKGMRDEERAQKQDKRADLAEERAGSAEARAERKEYREEASRICRIGWRAEVPLSFQPGSKPGTAAISTRKAVTLRRPRPASTRSAPRTRASRSTARSLRSRSKIPTMRASARSSPRSKIRRPGLGHSRRKPRPVAIAEAHSQRVERAGPAGSRAVTAMLNARQRSVGGRSRTSSSCR